MRGYLLDTNVVSEYSHPFPPDVRVKTWIDSQDEDAMYLSVLTLGEIRKGTTLLPSGSKRAQLERWLEIELPARFSDRVLSVNAEVSEIWGDYGR
jgi:toxin FitB